MTVDGWIRFWEITFILNVALFYLTFLVIVPLGAKDLVAFFRHLDAGSEKSDDRDDE